MSDSLHSPDDRGWQILLLGGASGVGKTRVSYRLARHYGVGLTEVDDFQVILQAMTSPDEYPEFHFWRTQPEVASSMSEEEHLAFGRRYAQRMAQAIELVIANHLENRSPAVIEGDFIMPALAAQSRFGDFAATGQVRSLFLYEEDEDQIRRNYLAREGEDQPGRARISWRQSEGIRQEAQRRGLPAIPARPWTTVLERAIAAVQAG